MWHQAFQLHSWNQVASDNILNIGTQIQVKELAQFVCRNRHPNATGNEFDLTSNGAFIQEFSSEIQICNILWPFICNATAASLLCYIFLPNADSDLHFFPILIHKPQVHAFSEELLDYSGYFCSFRSQLDIT